LFFSDFNAKPKSFESPCLISSPSSTQTAHPLLRKSLAKAPASVVLPAPDNPVSHQVKLLELCSESKFFMLPSSGKAIF
jgi:hypothetical protein